MKVSAIFGPPGTGKTRTLVDLAEGRKDTLLLSYTKAAALEMKSRIKGNEGITASTMHSLAFHQLGLTRAQVVDAAKLKSFAEMAGVPMRGSESGSEEEQQEGDEYAAVVAYANNRSIGHMEAYDHFGRPGTMRRFTFFASAYEDWKAAYGYVDFDDMLKEWAKRGDLSQYKRVFLDEAQDCSPLQWVVLRTLLPEQCEVVIAGDDDQAIYEWNGADPHGMLDFMQATEGELHILRQSHRVPRMVHDLAHDVALAQIGRRVRKQFYPRNAVGNITTYNDFHYIDLQRIAADGGALVLARDRARLADIKRDLNRAMVPYSVMGGVSPWTSRIARELREGGKPEIPIHLREFYAQADLNKPIEVQLSTIHQAKGREHRRVVVDLNLPTRVLSGIYNDRDAELRVLYVALTRTSDELILSGGNPLFEPPSIIGG